MNFAQAWQAGKLGESQIANWLRYHHGMHVFPAYEKQTRDYKGPTLFCAEGDSLILPDLPGIKGDHLYWVEAKHKSAFTFYRKTRSWQTGIDVRLYEQYQDVQKRTGIGVYLMFVQGEGRAKDAPSDGPSGLYAGSLSYLMQHEDHRDEFRNGAYMVFWNECALRKIASLEELHSVTKTRRQSQTEPFVSAHI